MARTIRVAIALPADLVRAVNRARAGTGQSRSEFAQQAVEDRLRSAEEAKLQRARMKLLVEEYVRGYTEQPESEDDPLGPWPDQ